MAVDTRKMFLCYLLIFAMALVCGFCGKNTGNLSSYHSIFHLFTEGIQRRGCTKRCFLVPAKPIHILCVVSFMYCPFVIEKLALTGLRFGTFGALKVVQARA